MLDRKRQSIEELLEHLDGQQGAELGKLVAASKAPKEMPVEAMPEGMEAADEKDAPEMGDEMALPEVKAVPAEEAKEVAMGTEADESGESEMSDEELSEMLKQCLG